MARGEKRLLAWCWEEAEAVRIGQDALPKKLLAKSVPSATCWTYM